MVNSDVIDVIKKFEEAMEKELHDNSPFQPFKVIPKPNENAAELTGPNCNHTYYGVHALQIARSAAKSLNEAFSAGVKYGIQQSSTV